ncbi:MAG: hypothetical protein JXM74_03190 [Fusobacteriaceae bacterium]|nr:hypothetical protein [Fusobacteriaceae bacterium]
MKKVLLCMILSIFLGGQIIFAKDKVEVLPLFERGYLNLVMPESYEMSTFSKQNTQAPGIRITNDGNLITLSVQWAKNSDEKLPDDFIKKLIESNKKEMINYAVEKNLELKRIEGKEGKGYYFLLTVKNPEEVGYKYSMRSFMSVGNLMIVSTMLSNDESSKFLNI